MIRRYVNPFISLLELLNVKYTRHFSQRKYAEHPNKNNMLGLSQMLSDYKVESEGIKVDDKNTFDLVSLKPPFIAQMGTGFAVVSSISNQRIACKLNDLDIIIDDNQFRKSWTGVLLLVEANKDSEEPNYNEHRKKELLINLKNNLLIGTIFILCIIGLLYNQPNTGTIILIFVNLLGLYITYLLLRKQIHINSKIADKLCFVFAHGDCNDVIYTDAARLFGIISWSEIGAGYFIANLFIAIFIPSFIPYSAIINLLALPYSFWSVWYQKYRIQQWCILCLIVQIILWLLFSVNIALGLIIIPVFALENLIITGLLYILPMLSLNILLNLITHAQKEKALKYTYNNLKFSEGVFATLLHGQQSANIELGSSAIIFGNPDAQIRITIYSNPHCNPCARMHKKVNTLLTEKSNNLCIQYVFCSFGPEWEDSTKYLIAVYLENDLETTRSIYDEWFEIGKNDPDAFMKKYKANINNKPVLDEYDKHLKFGQNNNIDSTPTIFINGYLIPEFYDFEELKYIV